MRVLVIGGNGMLGHTVATELRNSSGFEVHVAVRNPDSCSMLGFDVTNIHSGIDATSLPALTSSLGTTMPMRFAVCAGG